MTTIHENSLAAYHAGRLDDFPERCRLILSALQLLGSATDRQICEHLEFHECNSVRPRITELIAAGVLEEIGTQIDDATGRAVRVVRIRPAPEAAGQLKLFDAA